MGNTKDKMRKKSKDLTSSSRGRCKRRGNGIVIIENNLHRFFIRSTTFTLLYQFKITRYSETDVYLTQLRDLTTVHCCLVDVRNFMLLLELAHNPIVTTQNVICTNFILCCTELTLNSRRLYLHFIWFSIICGCGFSFFFVLTVDEANCIHRHNITLITIIRLTFQIQQTWDWL